MTQVLMPQSREALLEILHSPPDYRLMAGGTDLLVALRERKLDAKRLVCLEKVTELRGVSREGNEIVIGAATPLQHVLDHPLVREHLRVLCQTIEVLGSPPIVHMATLGGNICTASPAADTLPALYTLSAAVELQSRDALRRVPISDLITGPRATVLAPGEVAVRICIPIPRPGCRSAYFKVGRRKAQAISIVSLAACVWLDSDGIVSAIKLAWGSVGPVVQRFPEIEARIAGKRLSEEVLRPLAEKAQRMVSPIDDIRASASYRRVVAGNLLRRLPEIEGGLV